MRFLFVDRILQSSPAEWVRGIKHITRDDFYLCDDGHGRHCFIPSLVGEALGQLAAWNVMAHNGFSKRPVAGIAAHARLYRNAYVGETLCLESFIDHLDESAVQYRGVARIAGEVVFSIDGALGPLLPMARFIDEAQVRQQFAEIDRPGEWSLENTPVHGAYDEETTGGVSRVAPMLFDRVLACEPGVSLRAEKRITRAAPYFPDHFPNQPVLPMTVLLQCKLNLAQMFVAKASYACAYRVSEVRRIKMNEFVYPGDVVISDVRLKSHEANELVLSYRSEVEGKRVCVVDVVMTATGAQ